MCHNCKRGAVWVKAHKYEISARRPMKKYEFRLVRYTGKTILLSGKIAAITCSGLAITETVILSRPTDQ